MLRLLKFKKFLPNVHCQILPFEDCLGTFCNFVSQNFEYK